MNSDYETKIQKLNASWRLHLSQQMGLDKNTFKLAQGSLGFGTTDSSGLFTMANAVPPDTDMYDAGGVRTFSGGYSSLLLALLPETGESLATALGDNYSDWIDYRNEFYKENKLSQKTAKELFETFAKRLADPDKGIKGISVFESCENSKLHKALNAMNKEENFQKFTSSSGQTQKLPIYAPTIDNAKNQVNLGKKIEIDFDSEIVEKSLTQAQIAGAASGFYKIFYGNVSGGIEKQLNEKACSSSFTVTGTINKFKTVPVSRGNWFDPNNNQYGRAYEAREDYAVWDPQANSGDWDSFFKQPDGKLARHVSQLLLVSDYTLTVTSKAAYSQEDYRKIKSNAQFGIWPFFWASHSATHTTDCKLNEKDHLETKYSLAKGLFEIWGVNVQDAPN